MNLQIRKLREEAGYLSIGALADAASIPARKISAWENGERRISLKDASDLADFLDCSLDDIAGRNFVENQHADTRRDTIIRCYERSTPVQQRFIMQSARYAELASREVPATTAETTECSPSTA